MYTTYGGDTYSEWKRNMKDASKEKTKLTRKFKENISWIQIIQYKDVPRNKDGFIRLLANSTPGHLDLIEELEDAEA
tara:strand:- start:50 stop:280 length:231 start_codon:yes stop_codon:yes gene_type:complete